MTDPPEGVPGLDPDYRVPLVPVWSWGCPRCGTDNVQRAVPVLPARESSHGEDEDGPESWGCQPPPWGGYAVCPGMVVCRGCSRKYRSEFLLLGADDDDDDDDDDGEEESPFRESLDIPDGM